MKTLQPGTYVLADDCKAVVRNGKITVSLKLNNTKPELRCRDCRHCIMACSKYNQRMAAPVCELQPKVNRAYFKPEEQHQARFYSVHRYDVACSKWEPKYKE